MATSVTSDNARRRAAGIVWRNPGGVLLSQGATPQVPSALAGLTAVFGMGTGVSPPPWPPETVRSPGLQNIVARRGHPSPVWPISVTPERSIASTSKFPSPRPISTGQLNALPHVHFRPINVVVWPRALPGCPCGRSHLGTGFALRCFQRLSHPKVANQQCPWQDN
jgi:hypothetical protein